MLTELPKTEFTGLYESIRNVIINGIDNQNEQEKIKKDISTFLQKEWDTDIHVLEANSKDSLLHYAARRGNTRVIDLLVAVGLNADSQNRFKHTPLYYACIAEKQNAVRALLAKGADVNLGIPGDTPFLATICDDNRLEQEDISANIVKMLILEGVDINQLGENGFSSLQLAVIHRKELMVKEIINTGRANLQFADSEGNTALHIVAKYRDRNTESANLKKEKKIAEFLIRHIEAINLQNKQGDTPLHLAVANGNRYVVELLLKKDYLFPQMNLLEIKNHDGLTIIHTTVQEANKGSRLEILKLLMRVATQEDLDSVNGMGETAMQMLDKIIDDTEISVPLNIDSHIEILTHNTGRLRFTADRLHFIATRLTNERNEEKIANTHIDMLSTNAVDLFRFAEHLSDSVEGLSNYVEPLTAAHMDLSDELEVVASGAKALHDRARKALDTENLSDYVIELSSEAKELSIRAKRLGSRTQQLLDDQEGLRRDALHYHTSVLIEAKAILAQSDYLAWKNEQSRLPTSFPDYAEYQRDNSLFMDFDNRSYRKATREYRRGVKDYNAGDYLEAVTKLRNAVRLYQQDFPSHKMLAKAYLHLGLAHFQESFYETARENIERSIEIFYQLQCYHDLEMAYKNLAMTYVDAIDADDAAEYERNKKKLIDNFSSDKEVLFSHLALASLYGELKKENSLPVGVSLNDLSLRESYHYSEAYKLTQGPIDSTANVVLQREIGVAEDANLGSYNIQHCVVAVAYDPHTRKVVLSHFDRASGPLTFSKQILAEFDPSHKIDIYLSGGRDRSVGAKKASDTNIDQVLKQLYFYRERFTVKSFDLGDKPSPEAIVFDLNSATLVHRTPNHPDTSLYSRSVKLRRQKIKSDYLYPLERVDFSESAASRQIHFSVQERQEIGQMLLYDAQFHLDQEMWRHNQQLYPLMEAMKDGGEAFNFNQALLENSEESSHAGPSAKRQCIRQRKKRNIGLLSCVDSRDEENIEEGKKKAFIQEFFKAGKVKELRKNTEFYEQLFKVYQQIDEVKASDAEIGDLTARANDISLDSIDPEFSGLVDEIQRNSGDEKAIREIIGKRGMMMESIFSKVSSWAMRGQMLGNIIGSAIDGNIEGAAESSVVIVGDTLLGRATGASPITWYFMVRSLADDIERLEAGDEGAVLKTELDSTVLALTYLSILKPELELAPELEALMVIEQIFLASKTLSAEDKILYLTRTEKAVEWARAFFGLKPEDYIQTLVDEVQANNQLIKSKVAFLEKNTDIQHYIFPTGAYEKYDCVSKKVREPDCNANISKCEKTVEECKTRIKLDADNTAYLDRKDDNILFKEKLNNPTKDNEYCSVRERVISACNSNAMRCTESVEVCETKTEDVGELLCLPSHHTRALSGEGKNAHLCHNAIGVSYSLDRTGQHTLIDLDEGKNEARTSSESATIFIVKNGDNTFTGGNKDDVFILQGNKITGILDGGHGDNTVDLTNFAPDTHHVEIDVAGNFRKEGKLSLFSGDESLKTKNINKIHARKNQQDTIKCDYHTKYVDGQGGKDSNNPDRISISEYASHSFNIQLVVNSYTTINNYAENGNFSYQIVSGKGNAHIKLPAHYANPYRGHHRFIFNDTLSDLMSIDIQNSESIPYSIAGYRDTHTVKNITFSFLSSSSFNERFNITISDIPTNIDYVIGDANTEIKIINDKNNRYLILQNTRKPASEIIKDYPTIANRLQSTIVLRSKAEFFMIGQGKHQILHNDPENISHLVGSGNENVYRVNIPEFNPEPEDSVPLVDVNIHNMAKGDTLASLDLRNVVKQLTHWVNDVDQLRIFSLQNESLAILLELKPNSYLRIILIEGLRWYSKLQVYLKNSIPMELELNHGRWSLKPIHSLKEAKAIPTALFKYYRPNNPQQIYHNQPDNQHQLGLVDLKNSSILDCDMRLRSGSLVLSYKNNPHIKVDNWNTYPPAREIAFIFSDAIVNAQCIFSHCNPKNVIEEFQQEKTKIENKFLPKKRGKRQQFIETSRDRLASAFDDELAPARNLAPKPGFWINRIFSMPKEIASSLLSTSSQSSEFPHQSKRIHRNEFECDQTTIMCLIKTGIVAFFGRLEFVDRMNQAERVLAEGNTHVDPLDYIQQQLEQGKVKYGQGQR